MIVIARAQPAAGSAHHDAGSARLVACRSTVGCAARTANTAVATGAHGAPYGLPMNLAEWPLVVGCAARTANTAVATGTHGAPYGGCQ